MREAVVRKIFGGLLALLSVVGAACSDNPIVGREPEISVSPLEVVYEGATPRDDPYIKTVTISNVGSLDLSVSLALAGDAAFNPAWPDDQIRIAPQGHVDLD